MNISIPSIDLSKRESIPEIRAILLSNGFFRSANISSLLPQELFQIIIKYFLMKLKWNRKLCGQSVSFINDCCIKIDDGTSACMVDYVIDSSINSSFSWTIKVHKICDASWIGFIDRTSKHEPNLNSHLICKPHNSFGFSKGYKQLYFVGSLKVKYLVSLPRKTKFDDEFRMDVHFTTKEIELFFNDQSLGIVWHNIPSKLVPIVSNYLLSASFTISSKNLFF